ncbi:unnamed protein product [Acanthoscelides obtectus]|uniref:Uncharacterized protein n=1 Tax=Acanthoscelides obtectus TaxID=200917 RepID=A0A9P0ME74_ACAOB|nr:unnamed protein product [Acanthoscelides obtectus]CAK1672576.1 hypothetical protein AOBTE_LOCUS28975 [Acanthoscelides obtectus]
MDIRIFFTKKRPLDDEDYPTGNNPSCFAEAKSLPTLSKAQDVNIQAIDLTLLQSEERFSDNDDLLMAISSIE